MKTHLLTLALAAASSVLPVIQTHAQSLTFDFKDPKGVNNVVFRLDAPLESINGTASGISGTLTLDPANPTDVQGKIVVDALSLVVPNPVMKEHMHGADWLETSKFPEITFEISKVANLKKDGHKGTADVTGKFTMKGVTKEITVPVSATYLPGRLKERGGNVDGDLLVLRVQFKLNRSDFGIQPGNHVDKVSEEIDLSMSIAGAAPKS
jgi:polyisoprenoid-binding protein YceI